MTSPTTISTTAMMMGVWTPRKVAWPSALKPSGRPEMFRPLVRIRVSPRNRLSDESVVTNGLMPILETMSPLKRPMAAPRTRPASTASEDRHVGW